MKESKPVLNSIISGMLGSLIISLIIFIAVQYNPTILLNLLQDRTTSSATTTEPVIKNFFSKETYTEESFVIKAVKNSKPAVVSIVITKDVPVVEQYYQQGPSIDPFFKQFFGDDFGSFGFQVPQYRQKGTEKKEVGGGSGFLVSSDGLIITNKHVVEDTAAEYTVFLNDGTKHTATVVARDPVNDIAVIRIAGKNFPHLIFSDSDIVEVGSTAIAIGNALGQFRNTVSVGVVSGLARSITAGSAGSTEQLEDVIQTDAAINPGNSGGPLLNLNGEVIGINVAVAVGSQNIGFSIPANIASAVVSSVEKTGKIVRPYLGIRYTSVTPELKKKNNLDVDYGVIVLRGEGKDELAVMPGSPADKAGIVENDIILELNGVKIKEQGLAKLIRNKKVGDLVTLKVVSKGKTKTLKITLEAMKG